MSFASETKKELVQIQTDQCCAKAELSALIRMNGVISLSNKGLVLDFATENAAIARRTIFYFRVSITTACTVVIA